MGQPDPQDPPKEVTPPLVPKTEQSPPEPEKDWKAETEKWMAFSRTHEAEAKKNKAAAAKLQELEDAKLSDNERMTKQLAEWQGKATAAEKQLARRNAGDEFGLTAKQAARLIGETEEELRADAKAYAEENGLTGGEKEVEKPPPTRRRPTPNLRGGGNPEGETEETDPQKLAAKIRR